MATTSEEHSRRANHPLLTAQITQSWPREVLTRKDWPRTFQGLKRDQFLLLVEDHLEGKSGASSRITVIPAPMAHTRAVAVKKHVVGFMVRANGALSVTGSPPICLSSWDGTILLTAGDKDDLLIILLNQHRQRGFLSWTMFVFNTNGTFTSQLAHAFFNSFYNFLTMNCKFFITCVVAIIIATTPSTQTAATQQPMSANTGNTTLKTTSFTTSPSFTRPPCVCE